MKYFVKYIPIDNKLHLCSIDINDNDVVLDENFNEWIVKDCSDKHNVYCLTKDGFGSCLTCIVKDCNDEKGKIKEEILYKVIAEISNLAKWVKEGDEFDESEIRLIPLFKRKQVGFDKNLNRPFIGQIEVAKIVKIKCPNCETFH